MGCGEVNRENIFIIFFPHHPHETMDKCNWFVSIISPYGWRNRKRRNSLSHETMGKVNEPPHYTPHPLQWFLLIISRLLTKPHGREMIFPHCIHPSHNTLIDQCGRIIWWVCWYIIENILILFPYLFLMDNGEFMLGFPHYPLPPK